MGASLTEGDLKRWPCVSHTLLLVCYGPPCDSDDTPKRVYRENGKEERERDAERAKKERRERERATIERSEEREREREREEMESSKGKDVAMHC